jgi:hypothetical protein
MGVGPASQKAISARRQQRCDLWQSWWPART